MAGRRKRLRWMLLVWLLFLVGCWGKTEKLEEKIPVSFEVCKETELPDRVADLIQKKKKSPFRFSYEDSAHLYLAIGYGEQPQGEYVAAVKEIYETERGIYVNTTLVSLSHRENWSVGEPSVFPYVVLRCARREKNVFFCIFSAEKAYIKGGTCLSV